MSQARIAILGAGGTIAMEGAHSFDWVDYGDTGIINDVETIVSRLDVGLPDVVLVPHSVRALPSTGITPDDWRELARAIDDLLEREPDLAGVVVTHGTASLEETAFFLHLVHRHRAPIVLVGAQRPPNTAASDAVANLRAAIAAARCEGLRDMGAVVVMNGMVHLARDVTKLSNFALDAFDSLEFGPIARVEPDGRVTIARLPPPRSRPFDIAILKSALPRVDIAYSYAGADGAAIDAFVAAGARAVILAGFPPGRSTPGERAAAARAVAAGMTIVQSSRAPKGRVPLQDYNRAAGVLSGGGLSPNKARILVMLALASGATTAALQEMLMAF